MVFEKVKVKGGNPNLFFLLGRPERCRATREKRRGSEGSREAREMELIMHVDEGRGGKRMRRGEALPPWGLMHEERERGSEGIMRKLCFREKRGNCGREKIFAEKGMRR